MANPDEIARVLEELDAEHGLSGAVLVAQGGDVLFEKAYGFACRQLGVPNTIETKFHIASNTKMLIAMAALILFEQGRLDLQARPAAYMSELAAIHPEITIHHLLTHTSGVQEVYDVENLRFEIQKLKNEQGDLLTYLLKLPQLFAPGERWSYSTTGFILTGYLMERVTGLPYAELLNQYILAPLAMTNTGVDDPRRINPGRARGCGMENGQFVNAENDRLSDFAEHGELYSTARDLKKWCDAILDCRLVAPSTQALMFTPYAEVESSLQYGYGWFLSPRSRWHGGGTEGFVSRVRIYPAEKTSVIVLFNSEHVSPDIVLKALEPVIIE